MNAVLTADPPAPLRIAGFTVDLRREALIDAAGSAVELRPQAWQVLRHLAMHAGQLVRKDELMAAVWPDVVVTDDSLVQAVGDVRRALGEAGREAIRTVPRRGYLLLTAASPAPSDDPPQQPLGHDRRSAVGLVTGGTALLALALMAIALWAVLGRGERADRAALAVPGKPPSVAVLPFRDPRGGADADALARSVAADLVGELARSPDLRVSSHQSSFQFTGGRATPLAEIGQRLHARYLVDGTVRREGEQLRLAVELLDSQSGQVMWSSSQTLGADALGEAQQGLVGRIAGTLQSRVMRIEERRALASPPRTLDVVVLTEQAKASFQRYNAAGMRESRRLLDQALQLDSGYAPAWVTLGMTNTVDIGLRLTGEWTLARLPEVMAQINRAIALRPDLPLAYVALSQAQALARNHDAALAAAQRCIALSPNDADCLYILGKAQLDSGQSAAALANLAQAVERNPLAPAYLPAFYATALWAEGRFDEAVRVTDQCLALAPDFWRCRQDRIAALVGLGRLPEAREEATRLQTQLPAINATHFASVFSEGAAAMRERRVDAALQAGIPMRKE